MMMPSSRRALLLRVGLDEAAELPLDTEGDEVDEVDVAGGAAEIVIGAAVSLVLLVEEAELDVVEEATAAEEVEERMLDAPMIEGVLPEAARRINGDEVLLVPGSCLIQLLTMNCSSSSSSTPVPESSSNNCVGTKSERASPKVVEYRALADDDNDKDDDDDDGEPLSIMFEDAR